MISAAAIVIGINMFADARLANVQLDLTQGEAVHLVAGHEAGPGRSEGTRHASAVLLPSTGHTVSAYGTYADHVREMLRDYASISHGKVKLEFFDPEPFSDTEDRAMAYGLQAAPFDRGRPSLFRPGGHEPGG